MAAPQQQPVYQQPVPMQSPAAVQAVTTTQQVPAVAKPPGPIRRLIGDGMRWV